jgi:uncharacterized peroxidase-related enzyme
MTAWIRMIPLEEATGDLARAYKNVTTPHGTVDNVMKVHSLRPHTMEGHVALYRSVLHTPDNTLPFWFLEVIASYTSSLNQCLYSFTHHFTNVRRLIKDKGKSERILAAIESRQPAAVFAGKELALMIYAGKLTTAVGQMEKADVDALHQVGCSDGEILEVNQVVAYFNYSNRLLNGLGVTTEGDVIGYYNDEDKPNGGHA